MSGITRAQHDKLLAPLDKNRVEARDGMSYLNISDVRRWLIRIFGFGGWSYTVSEASLVSHTEATNSKGKLNQVVSWKVKVALDIPALDAHYEGYAIGTSQQPSLGDAHDMAIKTAESDALKRCAVNLGDQFGLSLYFSKGREVVTSSVMRVLNEKMVDEKFTMGIDIPEDVQAALVGDLAARAEVITDAADDTIVIDTMTGEVLDAEDPGPGDVEDMSAEHALAAAKPKRASRAKAKVEGTDEDPVIEAGVQALNKAGVVAVPEDFWPAMSMIRAEENQQKRLQAATKYKLHLMNAGIRGDLEVESPNGTRITIERAFDVAMEGM